MKVEAKGCAGICGQNLPADWFDLMKSSKDGLQSHCQECHHYRKVHPVMYGGHEREVRLGHETREQALAAMRQVAPWRRQREGD